MKKGIVALFIFAAVPFFVLGYTSPGKPTGFVNDFAGIISAAEKTELETTLTELEKQTGAEVSVVTIPSLGNETVETYAVKLFEEWGIGKKGEDNGLLLLVALEEKKVRIEVGYGLEGYITDVRSSAIIRNVLTPAFKNGNYGEGILSATRMIAEVIKGNTSVLPETEPPQVKVDWFFFGIFIPIWLASILSRSKSWWLGGVLGGIAGIVIGFFFGFVFTGIVATILLTILGLAFDFIVSKAYHSSVNQGIHPPWWTGGRGGGFGGGSFGGFGGGRSGGGGASGGW
jgi:uncharacterized protein